MARIGKRLNLQSRLEIEEFYFAYRRDRMLIALLDYCLARLGCSLSRLDCCLHWLGLIYLPSGLAAIID